MQTQPGIGAQRQVARVTSVLLKGGSRQEGSPLCWAEVTGARNGTTFANPIRFKHDGTFSLNPAFDQFEIVPEEEAPAEIRSFLNRRRGNRR